MNYIGEGRHSFAGTCIQGAEARIPRGIRGREHPVRASMSPIMWDIYVYNSHIKAFDGTQEIKFRSEAKLTAWLQDKKIVAWKTYEAS